LPKVAQLIPDQPAVDSSAAFRDIFNVNNHKHSDDDDDEAGDSDSDSDSHSDNNQAVMAPKDRTSEFHSTLNSIKSRSALPLQTTAASSSKSKGKAKDQEARQPLIAKDESGRNVSASGGKGTKSEFGRMAAGIAKDINSTTMKLQKLAQCKSR
jgi:hypothetical protein